MGTTSVAAMEAGLYEAIFDHIAHPIFIKDRQFRFVLLNRALCELVGYRREEMIGKTDYDFFPEPEADFFRQKDLEMFTSGREVTIEQEPITDSAGVRHVLATTKVPLRAASGEVTHLVGIIHDITRLKEAEEALKNANEVLELRVAERTRALQLAQEELLRKERLAVLGRLVGGLAHQIRSPLGALTNAVYILKRRLEDLPPEAAHALEIIKEEAWRANRIISDMIDYARVRPISPTPVPVTEVIDAATRRGWITPTVRVELELPGSLPPVAIDRAQVEGAISNVVRNAVDAMPEGGPLRIDARQEGDEVVVGIQDTGAGVPEEVRERLFEPLVTTKADGLGLGLTTARALIENQGGRIDCVQSGPAGTRFEIRLPVAER
ncbi:MAG: PAS domain S-box protein [Deltaproteobacteria bacterium]|nr:PAS domain S-box protein [Deltaproteobacteria bacterium]